VALTRQPPSPPPPTAPPAGVTGRGSAGPLYIASRIGLLPGFGGLPRPSFAPAPTGGAGGRRVPLPLWRSWWAVARAGSRPSSRNNSLRPGPMAWRCDLAPPSLPRPGGGNIGVLLDLPPCGLDLKPPVVGGLFCRWRVLQLVVYSPIPDQGGRGWKRWPLLLFVGVAALLLLTFLPAGRGGEGCRVRRGVAVAGGNPRPFPSSGGGVVEMSGLVALAWCRGGPESDIEAPPPNKLMAGWILDLGLESPATPSLSPQQLLLHVAFTLPACRGGEGKSDVNMPRPWWSLWMRDVEGILSPGVGTSSARVPVLPAVLVRNGFASYPGGMFKHSPVSMLLRHAAILCSGGARIEILCSQRHTFI
jgi:hypothetical protein